jgi:Ca2+-binding EF-hand superfamily protein
LEDRLKKQFAQGDDNGDGVLSFKEFLQMMTAMAPHFPKRRVLRMFRFVPLLVEFSSADQIAERP